jgi:hypothetical protein
VDDEEGTDATSFRSAFERYCFRCRELLSVGTRGSGAEGGVTTRLKSVRQPGGALFMSAGGGPSAALSVNVCVDEVALLACTSTAVVLSTAADIVVVEWFMRVNPSTSSWRRAAQWTDKCDGDDRERISLYVS